MPSRTAIIIVSMCLVTLSAHPLLGQESEAQSVPAIVYGDKAPFHVIFDHSTGTVRVETPKGDTVDTWGAGGPGQPIVAPLFAVPPDRPVSVRIENANPLLYTYAVRSETLRPASIQSCTNVGGDLAQVAVMATLGALQGMAPTGAEMSEVFAEKDASLGSFADLMAPTGGSVPRAELALASLVESAAPEVEAYLDVMEPFLAASEAIDDSLRVVARLADGQPAAPLLAALRIGLEESLPGVASPTDVPRVVRKTISDHEPSVRSIVDAAEAIEDEGYSGVWADRARTLAARVWALDESTVDAASLAFQDALHRIERAEGNVTQTYVTGANPNYRRIRIELTRTDEYPEIPRFREGVELFTEPSHAMLCSISIGFTFMDRPVEYSDQNGVIGRAKVGDDLRTAASIALHLGSPRIPLLGALLGIGVGTQGVPDFYLGASLNVIRPLVFNAGWVFQRVQKLPDGLVVGGPFSAAFPSADDFPKRFGRAFFFGVSLRR